MFYDSLKAKVRFATKTLSLYRTLNVFERYIEVASIEDLAHAQIIARQENREIYCLGNGSNTFFQSKRIKSVIIKNRFPKEIRELGDNRFFVSSSVSVSRLLAYCFKEGRDSFYYLASVPAEVGGALAMNAGPGREVGGSVMDYVEELVFVENGEIRRVEPREIALGYRTTIFTGMGSKFILGAVFRFPRIDFNGVNPIKQRVMWAKEKQDLGSPNCGSVFKQADGRILHRLRGLSMFGASFSSKTDNWIVNRAKSGRGIRVLIGIARVCHWVIRKKCDLEIIVVK